MAEEPLALEVRKDALEQTRFTQLGGGADSLAAGEALLEVDGFALTANNVTYAVIGDAFHYHSFFPASAAGFIRVPVWGFATIAASRADGVEEGRRVYGYFPAASRLTVQPVAVTPNGFSDAAPQRAAGAAIYNSYAYARGRVGEGQAGGDAMAALYRPLFTTAYLLDRVHRGAGLNGAERVVVSSASSKTALSTAWLLQRAGVPVTGLTSASNMDFVQGTQCYSNVLSYDDVDELALEPTAFIDMAGNASILRRVHERLGAALKRSTLVGVTHHRDRGGTEGDDGAAGLPGRQPEFFFAPSAAEAVTKDLGRAAFESDLREATHAFLAEAAEWTRLDIGRGPEAVEAAWQRLLAGRADPATGLYLSL